MTDIFDYLLLQLTDEEKDLLYDLILSFDEEETAYTL